MKIKDNNFISLIKEKYIVIFLTIYFFINLSFLTKFPFVHSDEAWLSGLSRNYLEKNSPVVTESFFDLMPRFPHSIKIFFHYIQVFFIKVMGYKIFTFRVISLLVSILILYTLYEIGKYIFKSKKTSFILIVILSLDIHFIYTSHFARQEIMILFSMVLCFFIYLLKAPSLKKAVLLGLVTGLTIGIHPNSLFVAGVVGSLYIYDILFINKNQIKDFGIYILITGILAGFFVYISFIFDPNFLENYMRFGDQFDVFADPSSKTIQIKYFYLKLFYQVSGTYYIPNIKFQLILFLILFIYNFIKTFIFKNYSKNRITGLILFLLIAVNITYIVIGRYNQTSIIFMFPFFWLLFILTIKDIKFKKPLYVGVVIVLLSVSVSNILPFLNNDYEKYLENISNTIEPSDRVLANLNSEYYFENNRLFDYRNLNYLKDNNMSFSEYIKKNKIEYIIYPEEMDFIYNRRPVWNFIYGNLYYYYEDMANFLNQNCKLIDEFTSPYGMRLTLYTYEKDWNVKIYKVLEY